MSYLTVISLDDAKTYLGVDDTSRNAEITRMISSALRYVEQHTNHILYSRDRTYILSGRNYIKIYEHPITAVVKGIDKDGADVTLTFETNYDVCLGPTYTIYEGIDSDAIKLVLTIGYATAADIPEPIIEAGYMLIEHFFNQKETGNSEIPFACQQLIATYKRFWI